MGRIFKNLVPYWKSVIMILVLLVLQAFCDLSLPQYTSDIIDVGIQNKGVGHVMPEAVTENEYNLAQLFMTDSEKTIWQESYDSDNGIYRCNVKSEKKLSSYDDELVLPLIINNQMADEEKQKLLAMSQAGMLSDEMVSQIREKAEETVDTMGSTLVKSMGIAYAVKQDTNAGIDMDALQTKYLLGSGAKMIAMALLVALVASRVAAGIGRDLRGSVYKNVMNFSNAEMDKFSTASLITRTTNDIQQVQLVTVLMLRMVLYAPILGVGGIFKVMQTGAGMEWIIALAVLIIIGIVMVLMVVARNSYRSFRNTCIRT